MKKFWKVQNAIGMAHGKTFNSAKDAEKFAEKLASENPGRTYIVLSAISCFSTVPPTPPSVTKTVLR